MGQGKLIARLQPLMLLPALAERFGIACEGSFSPVPGINVARGTVLGQVSAAVNDVDTITISGSPTGGTFTVTVANNDGTFTTPAQAYNVSLANLAAALTALPNVGYTEVAGVQTSNVAVTGTPGSSYVITAANALAGLPIGVVSTDLGVNLTGGSSPSIAVAHTTTNDQAGQVKAYASGNSDGSQNPIAIAKFDFQVDQLGNITIGGVQTNDYGSLAAPSAGLALGYTSSIPCYVSGPFWASDLTGMDSTALTAFKSRTFAGNKSGTATNIYRIP